MQKYKENQTKSKLMEEERKNAYFAESVKAKEKENKTQERLKKKLEKKKALKDATGDDIDDLSKELEIVETTKKPVNPTASIIANPKFENNIEKHQKELEVTNNQLLESKSTIEQKQETLQSIDDQLSKIENLYKKLQTKKNNSANASS
jgi:septation ring formation regulator EzrA